jgi:hypothetical protein
VPDFVHAHFSDCVCVCDRERERQIVNINNLQLWLWCLIIVFLGSFQRSKAESEKEAGHWSEGYVILYLYIAYVPLQPRILSHKFATIFIV